MKLSRGYRKGFRRNFTQFSDFQASNSKKRKKYKKGSVPKGVL